MKIWQKIFLTTLFLCMTLVAINEIYFANNQLDSQIEQERENSINIYREMYHDIYADVEKTKTNTSTGLFLESNRDYINIIDEAVKKKNENDYGIKVIVKDITIVTNYNYLLATDVGQIIKDDADRGYIIQKVDNKYYFVMATRNMIDGYELTFLTERNITSIYEKYRIQTNNRLRVSILFSILIGMLLLISIKHMLNPLKKLNDNIDKIAEGQYGIKMDVKGDTEITDVMVGVNQMSEKIEKNMSQMEDMLESRRVFIGNMAHEMKTPLTAILGFSDILTIKQDATEEERREYADSIYKEALRLKTMSGKLMELVQLQQNEVKEDILDLRKLIKDVAEIEKVILSNESKKLSVSLNEAFILGDEDLIKSLFYNILDNARKATKEGKTIYITMYMNSNNIVTSIRDEGDGISKDEIDKVMEPFYMVDKSRTRKSGGAGLGLALCHKIVEISNGELKIESEEGHGCNVLVSFPVQKCINIVGEEVENGK